MATRQQSDTANTIGCGCFLVFLLLAGFMVAVGFNLANRIFA